MLTKNSAMFEPKVGGILNTQQSPHGSRYFKGEALIYCTEKGTSLIESTRPLWVNAGYMFIVVECYADNASIYTRFWFWPSISATEE